MLAFLSSFLIIFIAEMGDKTQLLAIAFASKYKIYQVIIAISLATFICNAIAVLLGGFLVAVVPLDIISFLAAVSFICFGIWTLREKGTDRAKETNSNLGPFLTVLFAFLFAELGDKTQLATISLVVEYKNILGVLLGATAGMILSNVVGMIVGLLLKKHLPEKVIKWISALIFIFFGIFGLTRLLFF